MVKITNDLAKNIHYELGEHFGSGVGVSSGRFRVAFSRAVEGTKYENKSLREKDEYSGSAKMLVNDERIHVSFSVRPFGGGGGAGEAGTIVVINMIGDDRIAHAEMSDVIKQAESVANTYSG